MDAAPATSTAGGRVRDVDAREGGRRLAQARLRLSEAAAVQPQRCERGPWAPNLRRWSGWNVPPGLPFHTTALAGKYPFFRQYDTAASSPGGGQTVSTRSEVGIYPPPSGRRRGCNTRWLASWKSKEPLPHRGTEGNK